MRPGEVGRWQPPARPRIHRALRPVRRGDAGGDVGAGAEAGVEQALGAQAIQRGFVERQALRLEHHLAVPCQPEPFEIGEDRGDMFGAAAGAVDILDAQQEAAAVRAGIIVREDRRPGVAEMQPPRGAGRESGVDNRKSGT